MSKLLVKTVFVLLIATLMSCRQAKPAVYSTETLNYLTELVAAKDKGIDSLIEVTKKNQDKFRFAEELQDRLSDRHSIEQAQNLASQGALDKAYDKLNDRVMERGFVKALSNSLDTIKAARLIERYLSNQKTSSLSITEQARELARIEANSSPYFRTSPVYTKWIKSQKQLITGKVINDREKIQESLISLKDILSLKNPELLEICILQEALFGKSNPYSQIKTSVGSKNYNSILTRGTNIYIQENFKKKAKSLNPTPASYNEKFQNVEYLASKGKAIQCLEKLQKLLKETEITRPLRQAIIARLIRSNGWNNVSLINGNLLDISYILETFYMANN